MRTSVFFGALLLAGRLAAQAADADIVVTATKEPTPADTLPVPVVVLGQDDLTGKSSVSDALSDTLAVRLQSQTPGQPALIAPGFGENGFGRVALLLDGLPQTNPDMSAPPLDLVPLFAIDRIEIVRGPLSALYGTGTSGGAVNLITKTPRLFTVALGAGLETDGSNRQTAALGVPISEGGLLLSMARDFSYPSQDRSDSGLYQGWGKFDLPFGSQKISAWAGYAKENTQLPGGLLESEYDSDPDSADNRADDSTRMETSGGVSWTASADDWTLAVPLSGLIRQTQFTTTSYGSYSRSELRRGDWEPMIGYQGTWAGADTRWNAGLGVSADQFTVKQYSDATFDHVSLTADISRWTGSAWSGAQMGWAGVWFLSADLRFEASHTQSSSSDGLADGHKDFWPVSGDIGLTWLTSPDWKTAVQLSRVYRYPFTDEMIFYSGSSYFPDHFFDDIEAEIGHGATLSTSWSGGGWTLSASATGLRMENEVAFDSTITPSYAPHGRNANLGPTWHASSLASVAWTLPLAVQKVQAGAEYGAEAAVFASGSNEGKFVPLIPAHRGRLWGKVTDKTLGSAQLSWSVSSGFYGAGDNANTGGLIPGRQSLDANATVYLGSSAWALEIYGRNLTNDRTPTYVNYVWYPSQGRVLGVSLNWTL